MGPSLSRKGRGLPLAAIDADRSGAADEHVKQPAADRDVLEEIGVLRLILLGRRGPEGMRQKRIQGSHFANLLQASQANRLVVERRIDPCMSEVFSWNDIPRAHMKMWRNEHKPGNMAVLVQAKRPGMRTIEEAAQA